MLCEYIFQWGYKHERKEYAFTLVGGTKHFCCHLKSKVVNTLNTLFQT